jgi:hypothetical protein
VLAATLLKSVRHHQCSVADASGGRLESEFGHILMLSRTSVTDSLPQVLHEKHWSEKSRQEMNNRDWRIFREDHRISNKNAGPNAPMPFRSWDEMPLPKPLRDAISLLNYVTPSPIQMASIPFGLRQRDVIGLAETGSGKTAAFVLPMLVYIMGQPAMTEAIAAEGPYALILAPTRELAQQIEDETINLAKFTGAKYSESFCIAILRESPSHSVCLFDTLGFSICRGQHTDASRAGFEVCFL